MDSIDEFLAVVRSKLLINPHYYHAVKLISDNGIEEELRFNHKPNKRSKYNQSSTTINDKNTSNTTTLSTSNNTIEDIELQIKQLQLLLKQLNNNNNNHNHNSTTNTDSTDQQQIDIPPNEISQSTLTVNNIELNQTFTNTSITTTDLIPIIAPTPTPTPPTPVPAPPIILQQSESAVLATRARSADAVKSTINNNNSTHINTSIITDTNIINAGKRSRQSTEPFKPENFDIPKTKRAKSGVSIQSVSDSEESTDTITDSQKITEWAKRFRDSYQVNRNISLGIGLEEITKITPPLLLSPDPLPIQSKEAHAEQKAVLLSQLKSPELSISIRSLISTGNTFNLLGYYLRSVFAHRLKAVVPHGEYIKQIKILLKVSNRNDAAALPELYLLIQKHYPNQTGSIQSLLTIPLFQTDISWTEIKPLTTKTKSHLIDGAIVAFQELIRPYADWYELQWVEEFKQESMNEGIRAKRNILLNDTNDHVQIIACDLNLLYLPAIATDTLDRYSSVYCLEIKPGYCINLEHHWVGKINHLPHEECNLRLNKAGKIVQIRDIMVGEPLSLDYGVDYWALAVAGIKCDEWKPVKKQNNNGELGNTEGQLRKARENIFREMHETVHNYTPLFDQIRHRLMIDQNSMPPFSGPLPESAKLEATLMEICEHVESLKEERA